MRSIILICALFITLADYVSLFAQDQWEWEKIPLPNSFTIGYAQQLRNGNIIISGVNNNGEWVDNEGLWMLNARLDSVLYEFPELPHVYNITEHNNNIYTRFKRPNSLFTRETYSEKHILKSTDQGKSWFPHQLIFRIDTFRKPQHWRFAYDTLRAASNFLSINDSTLIASCSHLPIIDLDWLDGRVTRSRKAQVYIFISYNNGVTWKSILSKELMCTRFDECTETRLSYDAKTQYIYCDLGDEGTFDTDPMIYKFRIKDTVPEVMVKPQNSIFALRNNHAILQRYRYLSLFDGKSYIPLITPFDTLPSPAGSELAITIDTDSSILAYSPTSLNDVYSNDVQLWRIHYKGSSIERVRTPFDSVIRYFTVLRDGRYFVQTYHNEIWASSDKGASWRQYQLGLDRTRITNISFDNQRRIYVGTYRGHGLLRSNQHIFQWEQLGGTHKTQSHIAIGNDGTVFRTQRESFDKKYYYIPQYSFHRLYRLLPNSSIWDTVDLRLSPNRTEPGVVDPQELVFDKNNALYISSGNCVQRSTDNGKTWQVIEDCNEGMPRTLCFLPDSSILFGAMRATLWKNGKSKIIKKLPELRDFGYSSARYSESLQTCFTIGHRAAIRRDFSTAYYLYYSRDNAYTWDSINLDYISAFVQPKPKHYIEPGSFLCVDSIGGVYMYDIFSPLLRTADQGETWHLLNGNLPAIPEFPTNLQITTMAASPEGWIYVGTATNGLWRSKQRFPPVGVQEEEQTTHTIRISPNPANTTIYLAGTHNAPAFIADMQGRTVFYGTDTMIDISTWHTGMYCLIIPSTGQKVLFAVMR